ncbi:MAG: alpha/beta hydrolase [bacterium]
MNISGPAGQLEYRLDVAQEPRNCLAILSHPHPQYGGNLHDAVLATAVETLHTHQISALRFNFRGVGTSAGTFDGTAEAQDLLAVSASCAQAYPDYDIWWIGYSFGAAMTMRALKHHQPQRCLLIAPPNKAMHMPVYTSAQPADVYAIAGARDSYVDVLELEQNSGIATLQIAGADHFFSGQHNQLADAISQWVARGVR